MPASIFEADGYPLVHTLENYIKPHLQIVGSDDVGKIYSTLAFTQSLLPLAGVPFFGFLYRATVESLPGAFSLVTAAFALAELALILASRWIAGRGGKGATAGAVPPPAYED